MLKIDCHVHSAYSHDAFQSFERILERVDRKGLDGVIIADHNNMSGCDILESVLSKRYKDLNARPIVIRAAEYSTDMGHLIVVGLKKPLELSLPFVEKKFDAQSIIIEAKKQNAYIILAHPYRIKSRYPSEWLLSQIDAIEVYNARSAFVRGHYLVNQMAIEKAKNIGLPITAGSDGHLPYEIGNAYIKINISKDNFKLEDLKTYQIEAYGYPSHPINECISQSYKGIVQKNPVMLFKQFPKALGSLFQWFKPEGHCLKGHVMTYQEEVKK